MNWKRAIWRPLSGEADLESQVVPKVAPPIREVVQEMIPVVAEGGSTILVFIPGYADLVRMHSWLYWNLPTAGSVNMGYVPPKPEQLTEDDEEEEQDFHGLGWYWLVCMPLKQVYLYRII